MTTESLFPTGEHSVTNYTGSYLDVASAADGSWMGPTADGTNNDVTFTFPTPTGDLNTGAGLQTIKLHIRKEITGGTDPTMTAYIRENGSATNLATLTAGETITNDTTGVEYTYTFDASVLALISGENLEVHVHGARSGGSGANRRNIAIDSVEWIADYTAGGAPVTVGLTGVSATSAVGSIVKAISSIALAGVLATSAIDNIIPLLSVSTSGVSSSSTVGTVSQSSSVTLSGVEGTSSIDSVTIPTLLTSQTAMTPFGEVVTLTATATRMTPHGEVISSVISAPPGSEAILTGVEAVAGIGSIDTSRSIQLSGIEATAEVGNISPTLSVIVALTGVQANSDVGTLSFTKSGSIQITGVGANAGIGGLGFTESGTIGITGVEATAQVGSVSAGGDLLLALTGVSSAAEVGSLTLSVSIPLTGTASVGAVGDLSNNTALSIDGVDAIADIGNVSVLGIVVGPICLDAFQGLITIEGMQSEINQTDGFNGTITNAEGFNSKVCEG